MVVAFEIAAQLTMQAADALDQEKPVTQLQMLVVPPARPAL
jgi:hypothetical protein